MGFGSAGATKGSTGFRLDTKRNACTAMHVWAKVPEGLRHFGLRLQGVLIESRPALKLLADHDTADTLFYVDPPYMHDTRKMAGSAYRHEMTDVDHSELLNALLELRGMVILSGYPSELYEKRLAGWRRVESRACIAAARGTGHRTEVLWISPSAAHGDLFRDVA